MKKVIAVIEKASDGGYGIYLPEMKGAALYGYGVTEDEARENLMENLESILEFYEEENRPIPEVLNGGDLEFDYRYDFSGFFKTYPFFNVSALAEAVGVNASLLRKYKNGLAFASRQQKEKIEQGIHSLSEKLSTVQF
ncbi:MAG: type II toxin-antitoxin system HicB family antitoxin [Proteiniphilum sp.]|jgi:predicted RNase H-like HicB family nuclease|uniref:type II toxin-antitoxin system HicB family antitoxin n=1 Tax=Proteiniphilum sp. TaxID=1926877 RepID=UPI002ABAA64B|nr:type II toxin-antitoxin system HicB family antitoxin [Proteiniphilum sp.]MDY9918229.1 type II toxin-antitoxin system HicB family antitoxin [Proteiniphilum sp.]